MNNALIILSSGLLALASLPANADNYASQHSRHGRQYIESNNNRQHTNNRKHSNHDRHDQQRHRHTGHDTHGHQHHNNSSRWSVSINLNNATHQSYNRRLHRNSHSNWDSASNHSSGLKNYSNSPLNITSGFSRGLYSTGFYSNSFNNPVITPRITTTTYSSNQSTRVSRQNRSRLHSSTTNLSRSLNRESRTSLLKDSQGNCFERSFDKKGRELMVEVNSSECDF